MFCCFVKASKDPCTVLNICQISGQDCNTLKRETEILGLIIILNVII